MSFPINLAKDGKDCDDLFSFIPMTGAPDNNILAWARVKLLNELAEQMKKDRSFSNLDELQKYWGKLLTDAIHFLRINDERERAFYKNANDDNGDKYQQENKTTWDTDGAEDNAPLNVYGFNELRNYFQQFRRFESMLYGAEEYYRDHVAHPFRVWLIGLGILKQFSDAFSLRVASRKNLVVADEKTAKTEWYSPASAELKDDKIRVSNAELGAIWTITALTHDLGYPLEKVEKINDQLEKMLAQFGKIGFSRSRFSFQTQHDHLVRHLLKLISSTLYYSDDKWFTHIRPKYLAKFAKSWEVFDHGIVSSLILMKTLTFFLESDCTTDPISPMNKEDARQFAIRSEILHAIATHTTPKVYHLSANTFPFLMILCDELQEWGRPTMADLREGNFTGKAEKVSINRCEIMKDSSDIECEVTYSFFEKEQQEKHVRRVFRTWHERLRPALDDDKRKMKFTWIIKFSGEKKTDSWTFKLDNNSQVFRQLAITDPNDRSFDISYLSG